MVVRPAYRRVGVGRRLHGPPTSRAIRSGSP